MAYHVVGVVGLQHVARGHDGLLVWIESAHGTHVVQRAGLGRVAVGGREVHRHDQRNLAAALDELPYRNRNIPSSVFTRLYILRQ